MVYQRIYTNKWTLSCAYSVAMVFLAQLAEGKGTSYMPTPFTLSTLCSQGVPPGNVIHSLTRLARYMVGSLKMNTALEYSTRVVQEGDRRCKKSTPNDLSYLTPLRIPLMNPVILSLPVLYHIAPFSFSLRLKSQRSAVISFNKHIHCSGFSPVLFQRLLAWSVKVLKCKSLFSTNVCLVQFTVHCVQFCVQSS